MTAKPKPEPGRILPVRRMECVRCGTPFEQMWSARKIKRLCPDCRQTR